MEPIEKFKKLKEINRIKTDIHKNRMMDGFIRLKKTFSNLSIAGDVLTIASSANHIYNELNKEEE